MPSRRIEAVIARRAVVQREIDEEEANEKPHWRRLARLKKIRRRLRDQIARLMRETIRPGPDPVAWRRRRLRACSR